MAELRVDRWVPAEPARVWAEWVDDPAGAGVERRDIGARWEAPGGDGPVRTRLVDKEPGRRVVLELAEPAGDSLVELILEAREGGTAVTVWHRGAAPTRHPGLRRRWETSLSTLAPRRPRWWPWVVAAAALAAVVAVALRATATEEAPVEQPIVEQPPTEPPPAEPPPAEPPPAEPPPRALDGVRELARDATHPIEGPWACEDLVCFRVGGRVAAVTASGAPAPIPDGFFRAADGHHLRGAVVRVAYADRFAGVVAGLEHASAEGAVTTLSRRRDVDHPRLRGDGRSVVFAAGAPGHQDLYEVVVGGGVRVLVAGEGDQSRPAPTRAGGVAWFERLEGQRWDVAWSAGDAPLVLARGVKLPTEAGPAVSADGRLVAWVREASDGDRIVVRDLVTGEERARSHTFGVDDLMFGPGDALVFTAPPGDVVGPRRLWLAPRP